MSENEIIEFDVAKQPHAEARREQRVAAMRRAFKAVREEHQSSTGGKATGKKTARKKRGKKKK